MNQLIDADERRFRVARSVYTDGALFDAEAERIFSRCWLYVGHDSEVARPNDYLTREIAGRPVIFLRDDAGAMRCFLNVCPHRGAQICRTRDGNARAFACFYHGWSFDNTGRVLHVAEAETYPPGFTDGGNDLVPVPRLEAYRGFWFLCFDRDAPPLRAYLAGACEYIDLVVDQAEAGLRSIGAPQEYGIRANWKLLAENSVDIQHVTALHPTYLELIATNSNGAIRRGRPRGASVDLGNGHTVVEREATYGRPVAQWIASWGDDSKAEIEAIYARLVRAFGEERARRMATLSRNLLIFPNLVINDIMSITVRSFQPVAVDRMDVTVWSFAPAEENDVALERRMTNFLEFLGPGGFATPDDIEALESCQRAFGARREAPWNDLSKGLGAPPDTMDELPQRVFWRAWLARLESADARA